MSRPDPARPASPQAQLEHAAEELAQRDPLWPEQLAVLAVIVLSFTLPEQLTLGPSWFLPTVEGLLFLGVVATTPRGGRHEPPRRRVVRIGLVSLMSAANVASLFFLARYGVRANVNAHALLAGAIVLWFTAVLLFGLWYWEMDRGGPIERTAESQDRVDFVFPQMVESQWAPRDWVPRLPDFLYLSFVNAATFGPPESHFPLTHIAKLVLSLQALGALATDTLIVARAVNLLH
jgi:uncharacterized membrane protein